MRTVRRAAGSAAASGRQRRRTRHDRSELFGAPIPITGMAGDQQAATIGQGCLVARRDQGDLRHRGLRARQHGRANRRARTTACSAPCCTSSAGERHYALEGSVFVAGSLVQWLRDALGMIVSAAETEALARSIAGQRRGGGGAGAVRARRAALAGRCARGDHRAELRQRRAPMSRAPRWRRWRTRRRTLPPPSPPTGAEWTSAADRRRDERERLDGAGHRRHARAAGRAARFRRDHRAGRGDAGGGRRRAARLAGRRGRGDDRQHRAVRAGDGRGCARAAAGPLGRRRWRSSSRRRARAPSRSRRRWIALRVHRETVAPGAVEPGDARVEAFGPAISSTRSGPEQRQLLVDRPAAARTAAGRGGAAGIRSVRRRNRRAG